MIPSLTTAWEKEFFGPVVGPALAGDGTLYLVDSLNRLQRLSPKGDPLWTRELRAPAVALAVNPERDEAAVLLQPGRLVCFAADGSFAWTTEVAGEPASLEPRPDGRAWLFASHSGLCREYLADGAAGASYHFQFNLLAACYLGEDSLAAVSATGRLVLLHRQSSRFQVFPLNRYVAGISSDRQGTLLALPVYKEGILLVRPQEKRMDTCDLERNVLLAALSEDGEFLLAGAGDGTLALVQGGGNVVFSRRFDQAVSGLALGPRLSRAAAATAEGRVYVLESAAERGDRYAFLDSSSPPAAPAAELSARWSLKLFAAERRPGPRRLWLPAGGQFLLALDECQVLQVIETAGRVMLKRDFLGDRLQVVLNPSGQVALAGDEYQLVAISLRNRSLIPLPSPAQTFSASDQGGLVLLGRDTADLELYLLGNPPALIWKSLAPAPILDLCLAPSGERWFGLFQDGWLRGLDLDQKQLWAQPVFAVPPIGPSSPPPETAATYRLHPWGQNLLLVSERAVTAYGPDGNQLWCVRGSEGVEAAEPFGSGVLIRERGNGFQLVGPEGGVRFSERPRAGKAFFYLDRQSNPALILAEGTSLTCRVAGQAAWRYEAPALVEDVAAGPEGVAVIAGEELIWLDLTGVVAKISRFDYLDL